jgi:ABC-type branched-subunit amino acid transport system substrate-binding protein
VNRIQSRFALALSVVTIWGGALACETPPQDDSIPIGLLLSYTGYLAANSVNSERALLMAIEAANRGDGVGGRPLRVLARDTHSEPRKVLEPADELYAADIAVLIGPDNTDLATQLRRLLQTRTVILPSFATASDVEFKPSSWFVMGAGLVQVACQLVSQYKADGRQNPLMVISPSGYNSSLSWEMLNRFGMPKYVLSTEEISSGAAVRPLTEALRSADAYILAASPTSASPLIYALAAIGALDDPSRWYLSPMLHTPVFLESIPKGVFEGARGVAPGTVAGAGDFRAQFAARWHDVPLDDAYPFYDAGAIAALALQRAQARTGTIPSGTTSDLSDHIIAVTRAGGVSVKWNEIERGLQLLRDGQEIEYFGLTGQLQFDVAGLAQNASTKWWTIGPEGFTDLPHTSECK